jgi:isocitrate dehydrogenase
MAKMSEKITVQKGKLVVPDQPIIPYLEGDGTGPEIWAATVKVIDAIVAKTYAGKRKIDWLKVSIGEASYRETGEYLPEKALDILKEHIVSIKGPFATPIGGGFRSINVSLRQRLNLYSCIRPVKWIPGTPSPVVRPDLVNMIIFRENIEDLYAGIEWDKDSEKGIKVRNFLNEEMGCSIPEGSGIGIKFLSVAGTERIMRKAMEHAVANNRKTVTIVHKGNIMKYTEGGFKNWCYDFAKREYGEYIVTEEEVSAGKSREGKIMINDRIADNMLQQVLLRSGEYDVIVCPNVNGDYLSDAVAAQAGGLGIAPGCNMGDFTAVFEATHGNAPKYAGLDKVNPSSLILSAEMMLRYLGWNEAADAVTAVLAKTIQQKVVTYDLARNIEGAKEVKTSEFAAALIANL